MDLEKTVEAIFNAHQNGEHYPQSWLGKIDLGDGYRVQNGLCGRYLAAGAVQSGWKIGVTAAAVREMFNCKEPVFGYMLRVLRFCFRRPGGRVRVICLPANSEAQRNRYG